MTLLLASAVSSLMVMRIRYGTTIIARAPNVEEGAEEHEEMAGQQAKVSQCRPRLLGAGLFGLVIVLTIVLL